MVDILAGMGLMRRAVDDYRDRQLNTESRRVALERQKKDDAFQDQMRPMQMENLALQRRSTQMQLDEADRRAKMQEEIRNAFSGGAGVSGAAEIARKYGDMESFERMSAYARKAEDEGMTDAVRWAKLGRLDEAARRYNGRGLDKIDELKLVDGRLIASVGGQDVDWGNLEDHARLLGLGNKVEWKDGQEYINGQPTGKFAQPNPYDKDRYKTVKNPDGSERLVDTHVPVAASAQPRGGYSKDDGKRLEDLAKDAFPDPGDTAPAEDRSLAAKQRADLAGISKQILKFNADMEGMTPEIAHNIARDMVIKRRDANGNQVSYRATERTPSGEEFDGIYYQHHNGPRFYRLSDRPARRAQPTATGLPKIDAKFLQILRENKDNPAALKEFDERIGIPGAAKRYLDQDASTFSGGDKFTHGDVRKIDQASGGR